MNQIWEMMLGNTSEKLKSFARGTLALEIISSIIGGIAVWADGGDVFVGLGIIFGGIMLAWFFALLTEGFATIVAKAESASAVQPQGSAFQNIVVKEAPKKSSPIPGINHDGSWNCGCGRNNSSYVSTCACGKNKREFIMENQK